MLGCVCEEAVFELIFLLGYSNLADSDSGLAFLLPLGVTSFALS